MLAVYGPEPFLANKTDIEKLQKQIAGGDSLLLDNPSVDQNRVPLFVFGKTSGIRYSMNFLVSSMHVGKIYPNKPYLETEYWKERPDTACKPWESLAARFYGWHGNLPGYLAAQIPPFGH